MKKCVCWVCTIVRRPMYGREKGDNRKSVNISIPVLVEKIVFSCRITNAGASVFQHANSSVSLYIYLQYLHVIRTGSTDRRRWQNNLIA